jgi:hypothetical protein
MILGVKRLLVCLAACMGATLIAAPALQAEDPPQACTLIGCLSGVGLEVAKAKDGVDRFRFCVRGRCRRTDVKKNGDVPFTLVKVDCTEEIDVRATLTTKDSEGRRLARYSTIVHLETNQPNGPGCEPTCFNGGTRFEGNRLVPVPPPPG